MLLLFVNVYLHVCMYIGTVNGDFDGLVNTK